MTERTPPTIPDRYKGTLVGAAVGDALGAPAEFNDPRSVKRLFGNNLRMTGGGVFNWKPGETTDDTDHTMAIVNSMVELKDYVPEDIGKRLVVWYEGGPKDIGGTTAASLSLLARGTSWQESGALAIRLRGAGPGNGSLMRTSPIGLYFRGHDNEIDKAAQEVSAITHAHESCVQACQMASHLVALLATGYSKSGAIDILKHKFPEKTSAGKNLRFALDGKKHHDGAYGYVFDTLSYALTSFIDANSFSEAVTKAIHEGWDTDTQASVVGAFAGAHWGNEQIPQHWKTPLNPYSTSELEQKAEQLFILNQTLKDTA